MRALKAATGPLWPTFLWQAPLETPVQVLVWQSPAGGGSPELPVGASDGSFEATVRLVARAELGGAVAIMLERVRELVAPGQSAKALPVAGRYVTVQWLRTEFIQADVDVTIPATGRNPFYGIDSYRVVSQPVGS